MKVIFTCDNRCFEWDFYCNSRCHVCGTKYHMIMEEEEWLNVGNFTSGTRFGNLPVHCVHTVGDRCMTEAQASVCTVCTNVLRIYGTLESIAPWLCECEEKSAAQSSHQQTLVEVKKRIRIHPLVPKISAEMRRRWLRAKYVIKPHNEQKRL